MVARLIAAACLAAAAVAPAAAFEPAGDLNGARLLWQPAPQPGARPTVLALHGCGGLFTRSGALESRYSDYAARWNARGWHVLLVDSFTGRGVRTICTERTGERTITVAQRRDDVNAALGWLGERAEVDRARVALVGWSNGGSTVLRTVNRPTWPLAPATAIAFYPGCAPAQRDAAYAPAVPLTLLVGALDDWTPPAPCIDLAQRLRARGAAVELVVYDGSYHGFDGTAPVRQRTDVPNGVRPEGVHVGGNPAARADAQARVDALLQRAFSTSP
jgi:dienelactone hydrolase